ncbi:MAG: YraN family protein [Planctomycetaceae bacterium]|jgi:putative endonuclease|nr:YraN family protein [Planctomycetaceae bacterium]
MLKILSKLLPTPLPKSSKQHRKSTSAKEKDVLGRAGEQAAADFLTAKGYQILQRNFLLPGGEIDIAALDGETLVIAEVKTRKNNRFGKPYEAVHETKQRQILRLAEQFMHQFRMMQSPVRFDVISVTGTSAEDFEIEHFIQAFRPQDLQR